VLELVSLLLAFNEVSTQAGMRRRGLLQSHASSAMYCVHMLRMRTLYCFLCTLRGLQVSCLAEWLRCPVQHFHDDVATLCVNCAGDVDHFQTEKSDSGWGCGWRNVMTRYGTKSSHAQACSCNVVLQHALCHAITAWPCM